jgi:uncharacterized protein YegP (UPF0339 family)
VTWKFEIYQDVVHEWRWRLLAPNGKIIADSGEGYATRANARRAAENVRARIAQAAIVDA